VVADLHVQLSQFPKEPERLQGRRLVEALQGEAHVDNRVVPGPHVRYVLQARFLAHSAEVDVRHPGTVTLEDLYDLAGHG
jgi:hypothetical protein